MKLKVIVLSLAVLIGINAFSQVKLGVRAGISSSSISASNTGDANYQISSLSNTKVGFQGGLVLQISVWGMFLQPEMLLSSTGGEIQVKDVNTSTVINQKFTKLDVPVIIGKKIGPLRLGLGPVASVILNKPSDAVNFSGTSVQNKFHNATFGYQLDLGLDVWKLAFDVKYEGNLSYLGNGVAIGSNTYKFDSR
ncbi:MAG TPA: outer membrane beta-barrel protein, partial [Bacteroidales bacterium]